MGQLGIGMALGIGLGGLPSSPPLNVVSVVQPSGAGFDVIMSFDGPATLNANSNSGQITFDAGNITAVAQESSTALRFTLDSDTMAATAWRITSAPNFINQGVVVPQSGTVA